MLKNNTVKNNTKNTEYFYLSKFSKGKIVKAKLNLDIKAKDTKWVLVFSKIKKLKKYFNIRKSIQPIPDKRKINLEQVGQYQQLILPLYFGWEIIIRHRRDWQNQVIKPFKTYWQYISVVTVLIILVSISLFLQQNNLTKAATYNFVQTSWAGGTSVLNANHTNNITNWTKYTSKDSNLTAGTEIVLTGMQAYGYNNPITIQSSQVSGSVDLSNFPVLISGTYADLATTGNGGYVTDAQGDDIIFTSDSAGTTQLDHEMESYNATTGEIQAWVRIPTLGYAADTVIYMWYGNSAVSTSQENITGVWDSNYEAVWHLAETSGAQLDSTSNNIDSSSITMTTQGSATGQINGADAFNGSSDNINLGNVLELTLPVTMSAWVYPTASDGEPIFVSNDAAVYTGYWLIVHPNDTIEIGTGDGEGVDVADRKSRNSSGTVTLNAWNYVVGVINSFANMDIYLAGALSNASYTGTAVAYDAVDASSFNIGTKTANSLNFSGTMDEVRISSAIRTADWVATEYNNQSSTSTFYTVGSRVASDNDGSLLSSAYNSESSANTIGSITWTESGTGDIQLQIRTAPDSGGSPDWVNGSGWCGPSNCAATTGDTDYAASYFTTTSTAAHSSQSSGSNDQWFQYRLWITSTDGVNTPTFSDLTIPYVVNSAPDFEASPGASQASSGIVYVNYSIRDIDATSGSGVVTPSFQYSLDNGSNWSNITTGLTTNATSTSENATSTKSVNEGSYTTYYAAWTPTEQISSYAAQAKIKVLINDGEGANATASSTSNAFEMDAKAPTVASAVYAVATTTDATVNLNATDDTALQMCITLDNTESNCVSYNSTSTIALASDPDTVYVIFKDAYGNTTSANAVTPATPANMIIRDLSNTTNVALYRLFVSWATVATPLDEFNNYRVWHSTDGSAYTLLTSIATRAVNYYLHDDLTATSTHYYKIATEDNTGNVSYFSTVVTDTADGQGGTDASPPTISSVSAGSIYTQSATITWTTDELADSTVGYSTTASNFDTEVGVATVTTTPHSVTLTGLSPNNKYYYQVKSADPDSNTATDNSGGAGYSFTTLSGPSISAVSASSVLNTSATITWNTDISSDNNIVYYSTNSNMSNALSSGGTDGTTVHSVGISDLSLNTKYYFYVASGVATDNNGGNYYYFNTTSDSSAPVITNVVSDLVTDDDLFVTWNTSEGATSRIAYGVLPGVYTTYTTPTTNYNTSHNVSVSSLANNTLYYYKVSSADAAGNTATSTENSTTTLEQLSEESAVTAREAAAAAAISCGGGGGSSIDRRLPKLSDVEVDNTKITWKTNEKAISIVSYGISSVEENSIINPDSLATLTKQHDVLITDLTPGITYKYQAMAIDASGNIGKSKKGTFNSGDFLGEGNLEFNDEGAVNEYAFLESISQATDFFKNISSQISLGAFESGVLSHITELASFIPPPIISGEPLLTVGSNTVSVEWNTEDEANGLVSFANEEYYLTNNDYDQTIGNPDLYLAGVHRVDILGLEPETTYHYRIKSTKEVGATTQSKDFVFTTLAELAQIETYTTEIISPEEVAFRWVTTVPTDSNIKYIPYRGGALNVDDSSTVANDVYTTIHEITVEDFESGVLYQVEMFGDTQSGNTINQIIQSFATSDDNLPPLIKQVKTDAALSLGKEIKVQAIISWYTNEPSTSRVYYAEGAGRSDEELTKSTAIDDSFVRRHIVVITNFNPGSIYRFQVESADSDGNSSKSRIYTILTPKQQESVFQVIMRNVEDTFGWLTAFK